MNEHPLVEQLRKTGLRATPQRVAVMQALHDIGAHTRADDLLARIAPTLPAITLSTVYRTLEKLRDARIVSETDLGQGGRQFELLGGAPHHHLICLHCNHIQEIPDSAIDQVRSEISTDFAFSARMDHLAIFGTCAHCLAAEAGTA